MLLESSLKMCATQQTKGGSNQEGHGRGMWKVVGRGEVHIGF